MNHNKHYGTIAHWFGEMSRGSIICDESSQRIFANRQSLHPDYQEPETGHRVSFQIETENNRAVARDVERVNPGYKNNDSVVITLTDWDWSKNGGYEMDVSNEGQPVFVLGQFLADQTRTLGRVIVLRARCAVIPTDNGCWSMPLSAVRLSPNPSLNRYTLRPPKKNKVKPYTFSVRNTAPKFKPKLSSRWLPKPVIPLRNPPKRICCRPIRL